MAYLSIDDDEPEPQPLPTREEALAEVADWKRRVNALYQDVIGWLPEDQGYEVDLSIQAPVHEPMLQALDLFPYKISILQIRRGGKRVLLFHPTGRWVMLTCGRVRIAVGERRWDTLLAKRNESGEVEWRYRDPNNWRHDECWRREHLLTMLGAVP